MLPDWVISQRKARGMCESCGQAPGVTFWQSLAGPLLCWACVEIKRADGLG
jgi:hypothetical protein